MPNSGIGAVWSMRSGSRSLEQRMHLSIEGGSSTWHHVEPGDREPRGSRWPRSLQCRARRRWSHRAGCNSARGRSRHPSVEGCNRSLLSAVSAPVAQRPERLAQPARVPHPLGADVSGSRTRAAQMLRVDRASQILRGRCSDEPAVQKLDSRGDPGDSSGCQNLAPRAFPLRPHRIWEAGDFPMIPGERHSIEHVRVH